MQLDRNEHRASPAASLTSLADFQWLAGDEAAPWINAEPAGSDTAEIARLRKQLSPERARLIVEQRALRKRARAKFAAADQMLFTGTGLEQATDEIVAAYKARRFRAGSLVADLCCGVGGDLRALAERGPALGIDRDPIVACCAQANAPSARVEVRDVSDVNLAECAAWHIDPNRRPGGRRSTNIENHDPPPEVLEALLAANPNAAIKLAPATKAMEHWHAEAEWEWISRRGECRQAVAWLGSLARAPARRRATVLANAVLANTSDASRTIVGVAGARPQVAARIGRYLFEPDAAVLASELDGVLAAEHELAAICPGAAYWTADRAVTDVALACFEVQEVMAPRVKTLRAWLRERDIGQLEMKQRGVDQDLEKLRQQLSLKGSQAATLILARDGHRVMAIMARRLPLG